ncbi:MAG: peptidase S66 [Chitinophagales bacterium]|nr:MAG: peptidase S66 [Chitinophagales bacterium]
MKIPPPLQPGDKVALVSPARKISRSEIAFALQTLKAWKLKTMLGKTIGKSYNQFAGDDSLRAADFQRMLDDDSVRAIFCARGGYGTVRIIDRLDFTRFLQKPKWIIGFSDITVLHAHVHQCLHIATLHASMPVSFSQNTRSALNNLRMILFGQTPHYQIQPHPLNVKGSASGILIGGNLSVLYSLAGSVSDPDTRGKILFLEDIDEYLYHIDRMLMQLKRSGKLEKLAGMIIGGFTKMKDNKIPYGNNAYEIIHEHIRDYDFPVVFGFPAGHLRNNCPIIFGATVQLQATRKAALISFT